MTDSAHARAQAGTATLTLVANKVDISLQPVITWETAARGEVQRKLEEVVGLLTRSDLLIVLAHDDQIIAEAIKSFLSGLSHVEKTPDKGLVINPLRWLWKKVDAALTGAAAAAGAGGYHLAAAHLPELHHVVGELLKLAVHPDESI